MPAQASHIEIDGVTFSVHFQGFDVPLQVHTSSAADVEFQPWYFPDYLSALGNCVSPTADGLKLDHVHLAREVLLHNDIDEALHHEFAPLALWWAVGGERTPADIATEELKSGGYAFRLRSWTAKERMEALSQCLQGQQSEVLEFDFIAYVTLMINASVVQIKPSIKIETLNAAISSDLLAAITALNVADSLAQEVAAWGSKPGLKQMFDSTLRLCKVLGWGPSQVWALPAADVDRLHAMLQYLDAADKKPLSRFASDPNAVVINIEDDV